MFDSKLLVYRKADFVIFLFPLVRFSLLTVLQFRNSEGVYRIWCIWVPNKELCLQCVSKLFFFLCRTRQDLASSCINNNVGNLQSLYDLDKKEKKQHHMDIKMRYAAQILHIFMYKTTAETECLSNCNRGICKSTKISDLVLAVNWKIPSLWNRRCIQI